MKDYIGMYVKKFESGSRGSLSLGSCGYDWGLSCGSYQLTLRWGNCINFLKKYFPTEASSLYFNKGKKDFSYKSYPGSEYCSSPEAVKSVWQKCYNKVGAEKFFEYEHNWIESNYYIPIKNKIKGILDLDSLNDRAYQECFWSWAVHRGSGGAYNEFKSVLSENRISSISNIDKEVLFDLIYDKRYNTTKFNRYKKGLMNGSSERETLRPLLSRGTFSGASQPVVVKEQITPNREIKVFPLEGTVKVILRTNVLNVRSSPEFSNNVVTTYSYGTTAAVVGITEDEKFYKLSDGNYITTGTPYVQFTKKSKTSLYLVRVKSNTLEIKKEPSDTSNTVGTIGKNGVYTIMEEKNRYGRLKSGAGWISLDNKHVTVLN